MVTTTATDPFLSGNFAPIPEEATIETLEVIGEIPTELAGMFLRNGPNPQFPPIGNYHWFDGDGMIHGVHIQDGKASYRNRYVQTKGYQTEKAAQKAIWTGIIEPPQMDIPEGPSKNTANTALVWHAGKFLATWEGGEPHALGLPELNTFGNYTFGDRLQSPMTAHPKVDPKTGEMFFFGYSFGPPYLHYSVVSAAGELLKTQPIALSVGVMMHDFAITEKYAVFMDLPLTFRPERMAQGQPAMAFEADSPSRFGILPRYGEASEIRWFESPACYAFHVLNAYEDGTEVVLIACRMEAFDLTGTGDPMKAIPFLYEWRFDLESGAVKEQQIAPYPCDFPQVNPAYLGYKMDYGYAARMSFSPLPLFDAVLKFDFRQGTGNTVVESYELGANCYCSETIFVPRPDATAEAEDDGWLLNYVHDESTNQSELLILSAQNLSGEAIARVLIPQRVPYGFHATWVNQDQILSTT